MCVCVCVRACVCRFVRCVHNHVYGLHVFLCRLLQAAKQPFVWSYIPNVLKVSTVNSCVCVCVFVCTCIHISTNTIVLCFYLIYCFSDIYIEAKYMHHRSGNLQC